MKKGIQILIATGAIAISVACSGCFLAGLGVGLVGGGAAVHAYDTKPGIEHKSTTSKTTTYGPDESTTTTTTHDVE